MQLGPISNARPHRLSFLACGGGVLLLCVAAVALALTLPVAGRANAAGTAFGVDTAEVGDPGNCKLEAWTSTADNRDAVVTANPSCIFDLGTPTEVSAQLARNREDGAWSASISPKAKLRVIPTAIGSFGFALAVGGTYDFSAGDTTSVFAYVPATLRLSEVVRINLNAGWRQDRETDRHLATYGAGLDWRMTQTVTLTIETFGELGPETATASETQPRYQAGLRYRPVDNYSIDLIYGQNINGENANWITLGTTLRLGGN